MMFNIVCRFFERRRSRFATSLLPGIERVIKPAMPVLTIPLSGHLSLDSLKRQLEPVGSRLTQAAPGGYSLVFDLLALDTYDTEVRSAYLDWHNHHRDKIHRVAVLTDKAVLRVVIAAAALAARGNVKTFQDRTEAAAWAVDGCARLTGS